MRFFKLYFLSACILSCSSQSRDRDQSARIETEYKLSAPDSLANQIWKYLTDTYSGKKIYLNSKDTAGTAVFSDESFTDIYYDNSNLQLLKKENGIRHRTRKVLTDSNNRKNNRELIQVKISGTVNNEITREEYKFNVEHGEDKKDNSVLDLLNSKKEREFTDKLKQFNISSASLRPFIKIVQDRKRICFNENDITVFGISLDSVNADYKSNKIHFTEIEIEANEIAYTNADPEDRKKMEMTIEKIKKDLLGHFSAVFQDQTPKYNKAYNKLKSSDKNFDAAFIHGNK